MPPNARKPAWRKALAAIAPADSRHGGPTLSPTEHFTDDVLDDRASNPPHPTQPPSDLRDIRAGTGGIHLPLPATFGITRRYGRRTIE